MNRVISLVKNLRVRRILTVFLAGMMFFVMQAFGYGHSIQALADNTVKTPEGIYYKGIPDTDIDKNVVRDGKQITENAKSGLKGAVENIKEKLNLDEPVPQSTKDFLNSTEKRVENAVKPITGEDKGYYQTP
ncbi:MAG: DUF6658 family protein [Heteroscytonema crispum UTEX LB 1556]